MNSRLKGLLGIMPLPILAVALALASHQLNLTPFALIALTTDLYVDSSEDRANGSFHTPRYLDRRPGE